jgi:transcriptional regulator GlxA family with amidase domain
MMNKMNFDPEIKINVGFLIYNQVEAMDLNGPIDVFTKANRFDNRYHLYTVSETSQLIPSEGGTTHMKASYSFENAPQADILIIPGAAVATISEICNNDNIINWIIQQDQNTKLTLSICTGSLILSKAKILDGKSATTHHLALDLLRQNPKIKVVEKVRYAEDGKFLTSAGITSGLDVALHIIEMISGKDVAEEIAQTMVYNRSANMDFIK